MLLSDVVRYCEPLETRALQRILDKSNVLPMHKHAIKIVLKERFKARRALPSKIASSKKDRSLFGAINRYGLQSYAIFLGVRVSSK